MVVQALIGWSVASAQAFLPIIGPDKYWEVLSCDPTLICNWNAGSRRYFEGDTVIEGRTYGKSYAQELISQWEGGPFCPPFTVSPNRVLTGVFIREEQSTGRIYRLNTDAGGGEQLLFDHSLEVGETWEVSPGDIVQLDSITIDAAWDGIPRRVYHFDHCQFVEGIGTVGSWDVFGPPSIHPPQCATLYCFEHTGHTAEGCSAPLSAGTASMHDPWFAAPNPANDRLNLSILDVPCRVRIHDQQGRTVMDVHLSNPLAELEIGSLLPGIYTYNTTSVNGPPRAGRFQVQR